MDIIETLATPDNDLDGALFEETVPDSAHYICRPRYAYPVQ